MGALENKKGYSTIVIDITLVSVCSVRTVVTYVTHLIMVFIRLKIIRSDLNTLRLSGMKHSKCHCPIKMCKVETV